MISLHCYQCRKTLLKTVVYSYSHANDSVDGEQQIKCKGCGFQNWFVDRRLVTVLPSHVQSEPFQAR